MDLSCCEQVLFHFINTYPHHNAIRCRPLSETSDSLIPLSRPGSTTTKLRAGQFNFFSLRTQLRCSILCTLLMSHFCSTKYATTIVCSINLNPLICQPRGSSLLTIFCRYGRLARPRLHLGSANASDSSLFVSLSLSFTSHVQCLLYCNIWLCNDNIVIIYI
jgi:hypothetical protein